MHLRLKAFGSYLLPPSVEMQLKQGGSHEVYGKQTRHMLMRS